MYIMVTEDVERKMIRKYLTNIFMSQKNTHEDLQSIESVMAISPTRYIDLFYKHMDYTRAIFGNLKIMKEDNMI